MANPFGNPSLPADTASDGLFSRQPGGRPLGFYTGAPARPQLFQAQVTPLTNGAGVLQAPTLIVPAVPQNRFVTLTAPRIPFVVLISLEQSCNALASFALPVGLPYEISLPGNTAIYSVTTSPVFVSVQIQIAPAIAADTERRLGPGA